jgi:hypothetical protein
METTELIDPALVASYLFVPVFEAFFKLQNLTLSQQLIGSFLDCPLVHCLVWC